MTKKKWIISVLCVLLMACMLTACGGEEPKENQIEVSDVFKDMDTVDMDGNAVNADIFKDYDYTMINCWSVNCPPCVREIPELEQLSKDLASEKIGVKGLLYDGQVGLSDATREEANQILEQAGAEYQQILLSEDMMKSKEISEMNVFPTTYIVDSEGSIVAIVTGANNVDGWKERLIGIIKDVEGEK